MTNRDKIITKLLYLYLLDFTGLKGQVVWATPQWSGIFLSQQTQVPTGFVTLDTPKSSISSFLWSLHMRAHQIRLKSPKHSIPFDCSIVLPSESSISWMFVVMINMMSVYLCVFELYEINCFWLFLKIWVKEQFISICTQKH